MIRNRTALIVAVTLAVVGAGFSPARALTPDDAKCRKLTSKGMRKLSTTVLKEQAKCFKLVMAGALTSVNCNDLGDPSFPGAVKVQSARAKLGKLTAKGCALAASPQALGFVLCPAPCSSIAIAGYADVASCLECVVEDCATDAIATTYGTPPPAPDTDQQKCQGLVGKALRVYWNAKMKEQQKCQAAEDNSPTGANCLLADPNGKVAKANAKLQTLIGKCTVAALGALDSCGADVTAEQNCVRATADQCVDQHFGDLYEPTGTDGIFVSASTGTPSGAGDISDPVDTIAGGLALAGVSGVNNLFIDGGVYGESVALVSDTNLLGGFNAGSGWVRDGSTTAVFGGTTAVLGSSVSNVLLDGLAIDSQSDVTPGGSSYGVRLLDSSSIVIRDTVITAGDGGDGTSGSTGAPGLSGFNGGNGGPGCEDSSIFCSSCSRPNGGGAGAGRSCNGTSGGNGGGGGRPGNGDGAGNTGGGGSLGSGPGGTVSGGGGGSGGSGGGGGNGGTGGSGTPGAIGSSGVGGSDFGGGSTSYVVANGVSGAAGSGGGGAGGGGGGGGGNDTCDSWGGGGGGGGGGGCGGAGGTRGTGAGGSFGVWASNTTVQLVDSNINTGAGGTGGTGGSGGNGGSGGSGGAGAGGEDDSGAGGNGNSGGTGGAGGHGGGGGGGPSVGVVCTNGGSLTESGTNTFNLGAAGSGGVSPGNAGTTGRNQNSSGC